MSWFRNLPLRFKLNLVIIMAAVLIAASVIFLLNRATNTLIEEVGQIGVEQESAVVEQRLSEIQTDLETSTTILSNSPVFLEAIEANSSFAFQILANTAVEALQVDTINIINTDGEVLLESDPAKSRVEDQREVLREALDGTQQTTVVAATVGDGEVIAFVSARPVEDSSGDIVGAMTMTRVLNSERLNTINFGRGGVELSLIVDNQVVTENTGVFDDDSEHVSEDFSLKTDFVANALAGTPVINPDVVYSDVGIPHSEAYIPVQGLDDDAPAGVLLVRVNNDTIAAFESDLVSAISLVLGVLGVLIIAVVILIVRNSVTRRIATLQESASSIAAGDYSQTVALQGSDELGQLAQSFNQMAQAVQSREADLSELNQTLEQRVKDRTAELEIATREALEATRLKDEFLSVMSHELRTPLNAIMGYQGILKLMGNLEDENLDMVKRTLANAERLLNLINDILDISRIEAGRLELVPTDIELRPFVDGLKSQMQVLAEEKDLQFSIKIDETVPPTIKVDEDGLTKILTNLVSNAIKFTDTGQVDLAISAQDSKLVINVKDTGIGIPSHMQEIIFDKFRQVDATSKRKAGGSGLGLNIVQQYLQSMGGSISVASNTGEGSTFTAKIPLSPVLEASPIGGQ